MDYYAIYKFLLPDEDSNVQPIVEPHVEPPVDSKPDEEEESTVLEQQESVPSSTNADVQVVFVEKKNNILPEQNANIPEVEANAASDIKEKEASSMAHKARPTKGQKKREKKKRTQQAKENAGGIK